MATRNVHKNDVNLVTLPQEAISEDRGLSYCKKPQLVLASTTDAVSYKNDRTAIAYKFDSMDVELIAPDGTVSSAAGVSVSFPYQSDAVGFVIDWRQVTDGGGALAQGCYRVQINWELAGNSGSFLYGSFELREYSTFNARNTVRLYVVLNDLVRKQGINYKDSGFAGTVRFEGKFGYMQPNYDTENNIHTDRTRYKVRNEALRTYELRSNFMLSCMTRLIDEEKLLAANQIYITDHNATNHIQNYYDFPVILSEEESPSFEYTDTVFAKIKALFLDKQAVHESKYDGNIAGSENVILNLPTTVNVASVDVSVNSTPEGSVSGSAVNVELTDSSGSVTPDSVTITGSDVSIVLPDAPPSAVGATLPKTAQTTSYATGDDGDLQKGRLADAFTLGINNPFGNTNRYTDELGGQTYTNNIVIDWMTYDTVAGTVLGYYRVKGGPDIWTAAVANAAATSVGTFTSGWRLTNINELHNLIKIGSLALGGQGRAFNWSPINQGNSNTRYWTSSILDQYTNQPYYFGNFFGGGGIPSTQNYNWLACRDFTVTGTTLT